MLDYIIKVLLFQTLFLAVYDLVLKRETFFQWNRTYLLITSLVAYVIPLIKINQVYEVIPQEYMVLLPEILLSPTAVITESFNWSGLFFTILFYTFWIGLLLASFLFLRKLYHLIYLIQTNDKEKRATYQLVNLKDTNAFSFFNYIFLGKVLSEDNRAQIIAHELVHVQQKHSIDLLLYELQKIVFWFNPFSYVFQQRIAELHEFIADGKTIKATEKINYFQNLLSQTFGTQKISFINQFFKFSLIKKRIVMLNKHKSKQVFKAKYLLLIPVLVSMLLYSSCERGEELANTKGKIQLEDVTNQYEIDELPFATVIKPPIFSGCEDAEDKKQCFNLKLRDYATQNFDISLTKELGLTSGKKKLYIQFLIDKNGEVVEAKARAPHEVLEEEGIRLVKSLPKMQAGEKENGEKIAVRYVLPISFVVE